MYHFLKTSLLILFFFLFINFSKAQTYPFVNYTVENGLSQAQILCIFQDNKGVMWYGTNGGGITKYDGNTFEYITVKDGLADNVVYAITKDNRGRILIGTNDGLSVYDGTNFKNYNTKNGLTHFRVYTIFIDSKGSILLGTGKGISVFQDYICRPYPVKQMLDTAIVYNIYEDSKNNLWFSTLGNGAFKYDRHILKNYATQNGLKSNYIYSVVEHSENSYWFLTNIAISELNKDGIKEINPANLKGEISYFSFLKDTNNVIWLASSAGLIKYYDNNFQLFTTENGLVNNKLYRVFKDIENNLWIGSKENGLSMLANEQFYVYSDKNGLIHTKINTAFQSKDERFWFGSANGLSIYEKGKFTNYSFKKDKKINAIAEDRGGNYWFGTDYGVLKYNGKTFERFNCSSLNDINDINDIFINSKGEKLLGTKGGLGIIKDEKIEAFNFAGLPQTSIFNIYEDEKGCYWFVTELGLYQYDGLRLKHFTEKDGFTRKSVTSIINDKTGNLWIATAAGLYKYSKGTFVHITEKNGLASNNIESILFDKAGNLLVGLPNGLDIIKLLKNDVYEITHYDSKSGFLGEECLLNSILLDTEGKIWIGTENGLTVYNPQYTRKNTLESIIRLKSVELFSQKTDWKFFSNSIIQDNIPVDLKLAFDFNYLTFNYIGVSHTMSKMVRYRFMLKGLDEDWQKETSKTEAVYSNIPPGNYEFLVMANNGEGVWNKNPISFKFVIKAPFWRTWWFYSAIGLIVLLFIFSYIKINTANSKILKQNKIIATKNLDLKEAYVLIADKNKSITDSINYAKRIQDSFLTSEKNLKKILKDYFILFKPRDIVSGDFYWAFDLPDRVLLACADCTGHGIPGAFMSLIGISLLNEISHSKNIVEPSKILDELRRVIIRALNPEQLDSGGKDGMDIVLISIFKTTNNGDVKIHFSGANNSLYLIDNQNNNASLLEFKGDKQPVGFYSKMTPFTQHEITVKKGDIIYLGTDGFADQFGGERGKKFMSRQLKNKLISINHLALHEQLTILENVFNEWKAELEQVDDITIMGIQL